jgi:hypothetical protein
MNWWRGISRLWLVASIVWLMFVGWHAKLPTAISAIWTHAPTSEEVASAQLAAQQHPHKGGWIDLVPTPPMTRDVAWSTIRAVGLRGIGEPLAVAALGFALLWTWRGFRPKSN